MSRLQRIVQRSSLKKRIQNARQIQHAHDNLEKLMQEAFVRGILANKDRLQKITKDLTYE